MAAPGPLPPLGLYVHLPWCTRKCPYCDFNSHAAADFPESAYLAALLADLDEERARIGARSIETVFIGGGTPSLFSVAAVEALLVGIRARVELALDCEITLEANPGSADADRFAGYRAAGVNRLSIGVQSFDDGALERIGRIHDAAAAHRAVEKAQVAGFERINIDLMYGLPGQTCQAALADVRGALDHGASHVSHYELTIEPNTLFHRSPPPRPDEDLLWGMHVASVAQLESAGLERYEISAYARPGERCRHNLNYWRFGDYVGIGAGAHGKLTVGPGAIERRAKTRNPRSYLAAAGTPAALHIERIGEQSALTTEFLMNALRLVDGVPADLLQARTQQTLDSIDRGLAASRERGWMDPDPQRLRATPAGLQSLNRLLALI